MSDRTPGVESWTPPDGAARLAAALGGLTRAPRAQTAYSAGIPPALAGLVGHDADAWLGAPAAGPAGDGDDGDDGQHHD